jgi:UPF0271 protein
MPEYDINCDLGEGYGIYRLSNDEVIFQYISSCNVACGFHAGDPTIMRKSIEYAIRNHVKIGAHPSYPDLQGFGRRSIFIQGEELYDLILYQISSLSGMAESKGKALHHVKFHGALYHAVMNDEETAKWAFQAVYDLSEDLIIYGQASSQGEKVCNSFGLKFFREGFADRVYEDDGSLRNRKLENALLMDPELICDQGIMLLREGKVKSSNGKMIEVHTVSPWELA